MITEGGGQISHAVHSPYTPYTPSPTLINAFSVGRESRNHDAVSNPQSSPDTINEVNALTSTVEVPQFAETNIHNQSVVGHWPGMMQDPQWTSVQNQPFNPSIPVVMSDQAPTTATMQFSHKITESEEQQVQGQDHMIQFQEQGIKATAVIQNCIQARIFRFPVTLVVAIAVLAVMAITIAVSIPFIILDFILSPRWVLWIWSNTRRRAH